MEGAIGKGPATSAPIGEATAGAAVPQQAAMLTAGTDTPASEAMSEFSGDSDHGIRDALSKASSWAGHIASTTLERAKELVTNITPDRAKRTGAFIVAGAAGTAGAIKGVGAVRHRLAHSHHNPSPIHRIQHLIHRQ